MKSQIKIIRTDEGFVGQHIQGDTVSYQTPPCRDSITASRALSQYIGTPSTGSSSQRTNVVALKTAAPPGKCCGRS